jgi:hypothetical protein
MARRTEACVDTAGFIAFLDRSDSHYPLFRRLFAGPPPRVTSALVIADGPAPLARRRDARRLIAAAAGEGIATSPASIASSETG